jgi:site-specific DNA-methyltransferase (adenine-specific)
MAFEGEAPNGAEMFLTERVALHHGDCRAVLATLPENSLDSCVTDPPYHLISIVKRFGDENAKPARPFARSNLVRDPDTLQPIIGKQSTSQYGRLSTGFMGKVWDGGNVAADPETWRAVYRVLKPGAHLLAMGGTRTYHRMACAIEDAGFEIRDCVQWLYGSGFPKSQNVAIAIDKQAGASEHRSKRFNTAGGGLPPIEKQELRSDNSEYQPYSPKIDAAREWEGWGTALKPACELIVLARKPLSEKTVAANVLKWGTGAINVDGCRVPTDEKLNSRDGYKTDGLHDGYKRPWMTDEKHDARSRIAIEKAECLGRWPANLIHDGSDEVVAAFPDGRSAGDYPSESRGTGNGTTYLPVKPQGQLYSDSGSAARFFYTAKADSDDRLGSKHPTIKPLDLIQYLVRLISPRGGTVLDPFAGSGTTGEAAWREGMRAVLIEREDEYCADIRRRMALVLAGPEERTRESIKARGQVEQNAGPLFDWKPRSQGSPIARVLQSCPLYPGCGCGTQSGPHTCEWRAQDRDRELYRGRTKSGDMM